MRYQTRNIVEKVFGRIEEFRRVTTRYDKSDLRFLSFIAYAFTQQKIMLPDSSGSKQFQTLFEGQM